MKTWFPSITSRWALFAMQNKWVMRIVKQLTQPCQKFFHLLPILFPRALLFPSPAFSLFLIFSSNFSNFFFFRALKLHDNSGKKKKKKFFFKSHLRFESSDTIFSILCDYQAEIKIFFCLVLVVKTPTKHTCIVCIIILYGKNNSFDKENSSDYFLSSIINPSRLNLKLSIKF